jgi:hypothetical protein
MPNFTQGSDLGDLLGHPSSNDSLLPLTGPYRTTYNGLRRTSTGNTDNDATADSLRVHVHSYNNNLDKLLAVGNLTATGQNLRIPYINAAGVFTLNKLTVNSITVLNGTLNQGTLYGGSLEDSLPLTGTTWDGGTY